MCIELRVVRVRSFQGCARVGCVPMSERSKRKRKPTEKSILANPPNPKWTEKELQAFFSGTHTLRLEMEFSPCCPRAVGGLRRAEGGRGGDYHPRSYDPGPAASVCSTVADLCTWLARIFAAFQKFGQDWLAVAREVRNHSHGDMEALYNQHKTLLEVPSVTVSILLAVHKDAPPPPPPRDSEVRVAQSFPACSPTYEFLLVLSPRAYGSRHTTPRRSRGTHLRGLRRR